MRKITLFFLMSVFGILSCDETEDPVLPLTSTYEVTHVTTYGSNDGSITVDVTGGLAPYEYKLNEGEFVLTNIFTDLTAGSYVVTVKDNTTLIETIEITIDQPVYSPMVVSYEKTDVGINGESTGNIIVNVTNGTAPYEYSIDGVTFVSSNVFSEINAGDYTITVKDDLEYTETVEVVINEPDVLTGNIEQTNLSTIRVTGNGGVSPYEYSIDNGTNYQISNIFVGLRVGSYVIIIRDAKGATYSATIIISDPPYSGTYSANIFYFHPTGGGSYPPSANPEDPFMEETNTKHLNPITNVLYETKFGIWEDLCWITINTDNSISYEVDDSWSFDVVLGDPFDPTKVSYVDPATGVIYLYYHYYGDSGARVFWETFTPQL